VHFNSPKRYKVKKLALSARLIHERQRLGLSQTIFGQIGGVSKRTQINYENGTKCPDTDYLLAIAEAGANVPYILMVDEVDGEKNGAIDTGERSLLEAYRKCTHIGKQALTTVAGALADVGIASEP
jgi:transcriptional regulator with XRE-family HTH domain